ncbi:ABC transporter ATP-binding protein [Paraburkholderia diazotrophica]|uniref:NitT/TauT family transport system ATP-binding protein n=1 Tax=Paraburkholderia diazotrophica TaxID=667676 RepID=A0A1H7C1H1_9BURK|nr:ABC transporter ATP-binding protein [Paraburkholderia diazotrophica]SEJ80852.1 NitT/TauT family transport system ATP-binding protein [Paraburkholderia diazotrophica]
MSSVAIETAYAPARINVRALSVEVGPPHARIATLDGLDVDIEPGQFVCVLGPSGCGKSTLLGAIAGHIATTQGTIAVDDETVDCPHPERGLVFQQHTLFPWKRVIDNVAFGLKMKGIGAHERRRQAAELLELVGLGGFDAHYPAQLSGGMQQRVEIARVLINRPRVLLMDEPFGALDAQTRRMMQTLLLDIWAKVRTTVVFVTHDIEEALFLADRILMLSKRPARVVADIAVPLPRPRSDDTTLDPTFIDIKRQCLSLLRDAA